MNAHTPEQGTDLDALAALAKKATPGPWFWRSAHTSSDGVYLQGAGTRIVMAFARMGMQRAQPLFRGHGGALYDAGRENLYEFDDAAYIAAANPTAILALVERLRKAERENALAWETHGSCRWSAAGLPACNSGVRETVNWCRPCLADRLREQS